MKNFFGNVTGNRAKTDIATIEYPEQKRRTRSASAASTA